MIYSKFRFALDIKKTQSQVSVPVLLNDTGWGLCINLIDDGKPFIISHGCRAVFVSKKPDGSTIFNDCLIEGDDTILYNFTANTTSVEGRHDCEIRLYGENGRKITCPRFTIVVDRRVVLDDDLGIDDDEKTAIDAILLREEARVSAENERTISESERVEAEKARAEAETARTEAENGRDEAERKRVEAETNRDKSVKIAFVRYSAYADGTNFTETWSSGKNYIGFAIANTAPTDKSEYTWCRFVGTSGGSADVSGLESRIATVERTLNGLEDFLESV